MYDVFNQTNFNTEVHELYLDLCSIGTGCLFVEEGNKGFDEDLIHFQTFRRFLPEKLRRLQSLPNDMYG